MPCYEPERSDEEKDSYIADAKRKGDAEGWYRQLRRSHLEAMMCDVLDVSGGILLTIPEVNHPVTLLSTLHPDIQLVYSMHKRAEKRG